MTQQLELNNYKQQIADLYSRRSHNYDESDWHLQITHRLVEYTQIISGQQVLDIATGTVHNFHPWRWNKPRLDLMQN
ncbi:MAG: hypothetical protein HXY43_08800 [Fischerella sp.]|jgi:ubiquinone/menaquinone biosynthesis C-methylase UbiE|uniref:hypothetical protein n=1 Tax=Fischerella sp. TaxID=1191 RepID=UPI0018460DFC|nr:hypothetical protein [Fischerella sp.]NWF59388.1 hypothetical protein [Fischerella sp.]